MFCAASLCQDNSSESSPIMRDEVGGTHGTGSETIPPYSISPDPSDSEVDACGLSSLAHPTDFQWGLGEGIVMPCQNHFCVDFEVCFGSLSCWKVQPLPILSLLEGAVRFSFNLFNIF